MAISQFVTGFCDAPATKATIRRSMYEVANDIGMPETWVEIRHEITHGTMPETHVLRKCAEDGIAWLWTQYWANVDTRQLDKQAQALKVAQMKELMLKLLPAKMELIKSQKPATAEEVLTKILALLSNGRDVSMLAEIFVQENILMPKRKMQVNPFPLTKDKNSAKRLLK
jgi:Las1-like